MAEISIIIPVYNTAEFLPKCLESVLDQTFQSFELILVDDGSTDASYEIMRQYAHIAQNISIFHQDNKGVSAARNLGLQNATGKWIAFLDSDDWLNRDYLEKLWTDIEDVNFVLCGMNLIDRNEISRPAMLRTKPTPYVENDVYKLSEIYNSLNMFAFCGPVCKLFLKSIIDSHSIRFPENLSFGEDSLFVAEYLHYISKIRVVNLPLYNVRSRADSLSASNMPLDQLINTYREVHRQTLSFCKIQGIEDLSSQESYYIDRLLFCSEKMRTSPNADFFRKERYLSYDYIYHSPYNKKSSNKLTYFFYLSGFFHCWYLYDLYISASTLCRRYR